MVGVFFRYPCALAFYGGGILCLGVENGICDILLGVVGLAFSAKLFGDIHQFGDIFR